MSTFETGQAKSGGSVDLHCHSTASDGFLSPTALVHKAQSVGLQVIALTDHDTVDGVAEAQSAAAGTSLSIVPGIELSSNHDDFELHLLGYFVDSSSTQLLAHLGWCQGKRIDRIQRMCERLTGIGLPLSFDDVLAHSSEGSVGRPHVALAMIDRGYVRSIGEAFERYLATGRPAFVKRDNVAPAQAIAIIIEAGGVAVMAHPLTAGHYQHLLPDLIAAGLGGLEAHYGEYNPASRARIATVARQNGLIATGGSDYHGDGFKEGRGLGAVDVPPAVVEELRSAARSQARA